MLPWLSTSAESVRYRPMENFDEFFQAQKEYEQQLYSAMPDRIDCEQQEHLENCEDVNFLLKKHPDAPVRLPASNGEEVVIKANAPTPLVNFILNPNEEGARQTIEWFRSLRGRFKTVETNILREGYRTQPSEENSEDPRSAIIGDGEGLQIVMVTESTCPACRFQLDVVSRIKALYPGVQVNVFQVNQDQAYFDRKVASEGFSGRMLEPNEVEALNITGWPYTKITDTSNDASDQFYGTKAIPSMITMMARLSAQEAEDEEAE